MIQTPPKVWPSNEYESNQPYAVLSHLDGVRIVRHHKSGFDRNTCYDVTDLEGHILWRVVEGIILTN